MSPPGHKKSEARTWQYATGATILQIDGAWSEEIERALATAPFDGLKVGSGLENTTKGFTAGSDEELEVELSAHGRAVNKVTRFPKARFPGFRVELVPPLDVMQAKPHWAYQNNLRY